MATSGGAFRYASTASATLPASAASCPSSARSSASALRVRGSSSTTSALMPLRPTRARRESPRDRPPSSESRSVPPSAASAAFATKRSSRLRERLSGGGGACSSATLGRAGRGRRRGPRHRRPSPDRDARRSPSSRSESHDAPDRLGCRRRPNADEPRFRPRPSAAAPKGATSRVSERSARGPPPRCPRARRGGREAARPWRGRRRGPAPCAASAGRLPKESGGKDLGLRRRRGERVGQGVTEDREDRRQRRHASRYQPGQADDGPPSSERVRAAPAANEPRSAAAEQFFHREVIPSASGPGRLGAHPRRASRSAPRNAAEPFDLCPAARLIPEDWPAS